MNVEQMVRNLVRHLAAMCRLGMLAGNYRACLLRTRCNVSGKLTPSSTLRAEIVPPILAM